MSIISSFIFFPFSSFCFSFSPPRSFSLSLFSFLFSLFISRRTHPNTHALSILSGSPLFSSSSPSSPVLPHYSHQARPPLHPPAASPRRLRPSTTKPDLPYVLWWRTLPLRDYPAIIFRSLAPMPSASLHPHWPGSLRPPHARARTPPGSSGPAPRGKLRTLTSRRR